MTKEQYIIIGIASGLIIWLIYWFPTIIQLGKMIVGYINDDPHKFEFRDIIGNKSSDFGLMISLFIFSLTPVVIWVYLWHFLAPVVLIVGVIYGALRLARFINRTRRTFKTIGEHAHSHENGKVKKEVVEAPKF